MKELFLDKSLVTNPNVTGELVLVYIALRKVMSDEVPLFSKETSVGIVSLNKMAFVLTGLCTEYDSNLLSILKQGIAELAKEDYIRIIKDLKNEYIIDFEKLYLDTEKDYFVKMFVEEIQQILLLEESIKKKMSLAFSEKEWVARLESQLRDESVFLQAKLESDCEFESNIWGEPNPLDIFIEEAV